MPGPSLIEHFGGLEDPRQSWKVLFSLPGILLLVLCATLAGAEDVVNIRRWGQMHQDFRRRLLPFKAGVPSHDTILDRGGGDLLAVKDNHPPPAFHLLRRRNLSRLRPACTTRSGATATTQPPACTAASRQPTPTTTAYEVRRHWVSHDVDRLTTARRFPGEPRFARLRAIAVVEAAVERSGRISLRRYYLSSMPLDAKLFASAVRCHWHVQNRLHRLLDIVFHEDLRRLRSGAGPRNTWPPSGTRP